MSRCVVLGIAVVLGAQAVSAQSGGEKCGFRWFTKDRDAFTKRLSSVHASDIILWHKAAKGPIPAISADDIFFQLAWFNPLWQSDNGPVSGAADKYSKRLSQLPQDVVEQWAPVIGGVSAFRAGLSLAAEDSLFPKEQFKRSGLTDLISQCK